MDEGKQHTQEKLKHSDLQQFHFRLVTMAVGIVVVLTIIGMIVFFAVLKFLNVA